MKILIAIIFFALGLKMSDDFINVESNIIVAILCISAASYFGISMLISLYRHINTSVLYVSNSTNNINDSDWYANDNNDWTSFYHSNEPKISINFSTNNAKIEGNVVINPEDITHHTYMKEHSKRSNSYTSHVYTHHISHDIEKNKDVSLSLIIDNNSDLSEECNNIYTTLEDLILANKLLSGSQRYALMQSIVHVDADNAPKIVLYIDKFLWKGAHITDELFSLNDIIDALTDKFNIVESDVTIYDYKPINLLDHYLKKQNDGK